MRSLFLFSFVNASISFTFAESRLFRGLRAWLKARSLFLGELVECGYCVGHWSAMLLTAIYRLRVFQFWWPLDFLVTVLALAWLSAFQWIALCWLMKLTGK